MFMTPFSAVAAMLMSSVSSTPLMVNNGTAVATIEAAAVAEIAQDTSSEMTVETIEPAPIAEATVARETDAEPVTIAASAVAFPDLSDDEVFDRAAEALEGMKTLKARFLQVSPSGSVYEGDVSIRRPGQLRFDYDDPSPQLIVATNGLVYVHDADLETTDSYPVSETPLKFLLSKSLDREAAELVDVMRSEDRVSLIIAATDSEMEGELALAFTAPDMELIGWGVREPNNAVTTVELSEVEIGAKLNNRLFRAPEAGGTFLRD